MFWSFPLDQSAQIALAFHLECDVRVGNLLFEDDFEVLVLSCLRIFEAIFDLLDSDKYIAFFKAYLSWKVLTEQFVASEFTDECKQFGLGFKNEAESFWVFD